MHLVSWRHYWCPQLFTWLTLVTSPTAWARIECDAVNQSSGTRCTLTPPPDTQRMKLNLALMRTSTFSSEGGFQWFKSIMCWLIPSSNQRYLVWVYFWVEIIRFWPERWNLIWHWWEQAHCLQSEAFDDLLVTGILFCFTLLSNSMSLVLALCLFLSWKN